MFLRYGIKQWAYIPQNLRVLRAHANQPGWDWDFYDKVLVLMACVSREKIALHGPWATRGQRGTLPFIRNQIM